MEHPDDPKTRAVVMRRAELGYPMIHEELEALTRATVTVTATVVPQVMSWRELEALAGSAGSIGYEDADVYVDVTPYLASERVYFIASADGAIKIGWSANVIKRLQNMQVGSPAKLVLLGTLPGGVAIERGIHRRFAHLRMRGEWFRDVPELREWIGRQCLRV